MDQNVSRRRFLKTVAAVGGGAAGAALSSATAGVVRGGDVLLRQAGPEVPVLAAGSCRFGCAAVGFDAGDIVHGELLPGSGHLVGEGDRGSSSRAAWPCAPTMPSNLGASRTETCAVFRNSPGFSGASGVQ